MAAVDGPAAVLPRQHSPPATWPTPARRPARGPLPYRAIGFVPVPSPGDTGGDRGPRPGAEWRA